MMRASVTALVVMVAACGTPTATYRDLERLGTEYEQGGESPLATRPAPTTAEEATARDTCGAAAHRDRIGTPVSGMTVPPGARVIAPGTAVTDDFRIERLNIITDAAGLITALQCY